MLENAGHVEKHFIDRYILIRSAIIAGCSFPDKIEALNRNDNSNNNNSVDDADASGISLRKLNNRLIRQKATARTYPGSKLNEFLSPGGHSEDEGERSAALKP